MSDIYHYLRIRRNARGLRKHGAEMLARVTAIFEDLSLRPMLNCGSLLGYMKQGRFDNSSKDIDLAVLADDVKDPATLITKMKAEGFRLRLDGKLHGPLEKIGRYFLLQFHHPKKQVSVDICFLHRYQDQIVYLEDRRADYLYRKYLGDARGSFEPYLGYFRGFSADVYEGLVPVMFEGSKVWIPQDPWRLLEVTYGPSIRKGKKDICCHMHLIRQGSHKGDFEIVDPSSSKIS